MQGLTLDAGALIAFERNDRRTIALILRTLQHDGSLAIPAGVVAQVWRDGRRQARLARLLATDNIEIVVLDDRGTREAGQLCGVAGTSDIVDATVVLCARARVHKAVTSDPDDLARLDPALELVVI
jgi:hypothetical protein